MTEDEFGTVAPGKTEADYIDEDEEYVNAPHEDSEDIKEFKNMTAKERKELREWSKKHTSSSYGWW